MTEMLTPALKDRLWHKLRQDLHTVLPSLTSDDRLICCCCGRLLPFQAFSLEHIIPQQALADDPPSVRATIPSLERSGYTLLCNTPLKLKGQQVASNGCNSWKGKFFDTELRQIFNSTYLNKKPKRDRSMMVSAIAAAFLALFSRYGYQVAFSSAGLLLREQFFTPGRLHSGLPLISQMILGGEMPEYDPSDLRSWSEPFRFDFSEKGFCSVAIRNYIISLAISRDPRVPIATHVRFVPSQYKLRPDFQAFFE